MMLMKKALLLTVAAALLPSVLPYSTPSPNSNPNDNHLVFSLKNYHQQSALETSQSLDASRLHFQILVVDDDNAQGRISEGLLAQIAEDNDAMCVLFPSSCTIMNSKAPRDAAASERVLSICNDLRLCPSRSQAMGTEFCTSYLDEYDLVVCMTEDIQSRIFRSLEGTDNQDYYRPRCRLMAEFLSADFVSNILQQPAEGDEQQENPLSDPQQQEQWKMLDAQYQAKVEPYLDDIVGRSSTLFASNDLAQDWPTTQAGLIWACAGIVEFCLTTIEMQMQASLDSLLQRVVYKPEHLQQSFASVDRQLRKCNSSVTGYFSPRQRESRYKEHVEELQRRWEQTEGTVETKE